MGDMARRLQLWFAAAFAGVMITFLMPVQAWAAENDVVEAVRKARRSGGFGLFGLVCCLVAVGAIVVAIVLISRRRKRR
ncbi:hypothetical protein [Actinoplanes utahensis]|uniref:hypothetical protein n=1 Tax=Actinoplanes utahensis TaxID=1869 RepID=UPI000B15E27E|nr:hypothetical protein [Actinoplanes utahensis]GIF33123.1 hypothetical protein Aut01nite_61090 [Actinoplanes utahensis]